MEKRQGSAGQTGYPGKPAVCRSVFMSLEEIEAERRKNRWNPYVGEEETAPALQAEEDRNAHAKYNSCRAEMPAAQAEENGNAPAKESPDGKGTSALCREEDAQAPEEESGVSYIPGAGCPLPFVRYEQMLEALEAEKEEEEDLRRLQTLYPETAKQLLPYIEDVCDRLEYDGSFMFDEYPDLTTICRLQGEILDRAGEEGEQEETPEYPEELIRVLLVHEMHRRRCRRHCIQRQAK